MDDYRLSFHCQDCEDIGVDKFAYDYTAANCEVWHCQSCDAELTTNHEPKPDQF